MRAVWRTGGHGADCCLLLYGDTVADVFRAAAEAIRQSGTRHARQRHAEIGKERTVSLEAPNLGTLLVEWINELIGLSEIEGAPHECVEVRIDGDGPTASCHAILRPLPQPWRSPLKAATLHDLLLEPKGRRWHARVVCDL